MEGNLNAYAEILDQLSATPDALSSSPEMATLLQKQTQIDDEIVDFRLMKILREENPYLPQINLARFSGMGQSCPRQHLENLLRQRRHLMRRLHGLPTNQWERTGVHEIEGHVTFKELVRRMIEKDRQVINTCRNIFLRYEQHDTSVN
ncbi:MAG TPA: hypothetical protein PKV71_03695 [Calditrichia bacterium]|nr:hypothetical protein [Calditrichia bacterium]HQV30950.1 hypothetical protein [Calditrichia bacterium]